MEKFTKAKEGLKIVGDGCRAILDRMKQNRYTWMVVGVNLFAIYQFDKLRSEADEETMENLRSIERRARDMLERWKQDVQAGKKTKSLDEFRDYLGLNGRMKGYPQLDKLFDEYRKYDE